MVVSTAMFSLSFYVVTWWFDINFVCVQLTAICMLLSVCYYLYVTICMLLSVCYYLYVTICMLLSVCYYLYVTICMLLSVCYYLYVTICMLRYFCLATIVCYCCFRLDLYGNNYELSRIGKDIICIANNVII